MSAGSPEYLKRQNTLNVEVVTPESFPKLFSDNPDLSAQYKDLPSDTRLYTLVTTSQPYTFDKLLSDRTPFTEALTHQHRIKYPFTKIAELPFQIGARKMPVKDRLEVFKGAVPDRRCGEPTGHVDEAVNNYLALQIGLDQAVIPKSGRKIQSADELIKLAQAEGVSLDIEALRQSFVKVVLKPSVIDFERRGLLTDREPFYKKSVEWIADLSLRETQSHPGHFTQPFIDDSFRDLPLPDYITYFCAVYGRYLYGISQAEPLRGFDLVGANRSVENLESYVENIIKSEMVSKIGVSNGARADMYFSQLMELADSKGMDNVNKRAAETRRNFEPYLAGVQLYLEAVNKLYKYKPSNIK